MRERCSMVDARNVCQHRKTTGSGTRGGKKKRPGSGEAATQQQQTHGRGGKGKNKSGGVEMVNAKGRNHRRQS